jgi:hypothetical protein
MLKAYIVRYGSHGYSYDSGESVLVYHFTEEAAKELGRHCLTHANSWEETDVERATEHDARCVSLTEPAQEEDPEYLREKGWRYEDEKMCHSCGNAPFGQEKYAVCNECSMCKECGCEDLEGPCPQSEGWSCEGMESPPTSSEPSPTK